VRRPACIDADTRSGRARDRGADRHVSANCDICAHRHTDCFADSYDCADRHSHADRYSHADQHTDIDAA
jgi:hypothetical protein